MISFSTYMLLSHLFFSEHRQLSLRLVILGNDFSRVCFSLTKLNHQNLPKWKKSQKQKSLTLLCKRNLQLSTFSVSSRLGNCDYSFGIRILPFQRQRKYKLAYEAKLH